MNQNCNTKAIVSTDIKNSHIFVDGNNILSKIDELIQNERDAINKFSKDYNYHLWVRRGILLVQQIIQKEIDKEKDK